MNLVATMLVNIVGQKVTTKMPLGEKVKAGDTGVVREATMAGCIVVVEFDSDPGQRHRMQRIDVEQYVAPSSPIVEDTDLDELP